MLADQPDWTTAIGQAYVNQPTDVTRSIQRLRAGRAKLTVRWSATNNKESISKMAQS